MRIVDGHCHVSPVWYEPVESLVAQMDRSGVAQAVLVQMLGELDNGYLEACKQRFAGSFAIVAGVDPGRPDACNTLAALAGEGAAGVRLRPDARSPGADPLAIWRAAERSGLAVSCVGTAEKFAAREFSTLLETFPALPVVLEHLGGTSRADAETPEARRRAFETARFPNVFLKVPGLGELAPRASLLEKGGPARPSVLMEAVERFGPERLIWGSDFPVVSSREGYANALGWVREALADLPAGAQEAIFGGTARRVFKLPAVL